MEFQFESIHHYHHRPISALTFSVEADDAGEAIDRAIERQSRWLDERFLNADDVTVDIYLLDEDTSTHVVRWTGEEWEEAR